ncbi:MAG: hypothetical protein AAF340_17520 [Pseudomonadota bacterium]
MRQVVKGLLGVFSACLALVAGSVFAGDTPVLTLPETADAEVVLALPQGASELVAGETLQLFVGAPEACCVGRSAMAGRYVVTGADIRFAPAFDFIEGQSYTARWRDAFDAVHVSGFVIGQAASTEAPRVTGIYPSGPVIPENTLRFYIHFSAPMRPHVAEDFIQLVDADGAVDREAFMSFKQELWNDDRTRLTLLMDPGRIKRGVAQNRSLGPALEAGGHYAIVIDDGWEAANGSAGTARFVQAFTVTDPLRSLPDPGLWRIDAPKAGSLEPLIVEFDRPFDQNLVARSLAVFDAGGAQVTGSVSVEAHQRVWRFVPAEPWQGARVEIVVDARLEDVAGNNFRELLDHAAGTKLRDIDEVARWVDLTP